MKKIIDVLFAVAVMVLVVFASKLSHDVKILKDTVVEQKSTIVQYAGIMTDYESQIAEYEAKIEGLSTELTNMVEGREYKLDWRYDDVAYSYYNENSGLFPKKSLLKSY